ncbi:MAG: SAM-dependent methyltransferase [Geobacteraceae bacterium]|nr:SAM-dependent methyltransferase [Geobacteraceae bacterium]
MEQNDDSALREIILDRIRSRGRITFAEFMEASLYQPGLGYYTSPGRKVGAEGDFYTSSNVHRLFGRLIAREIHRMWETMGEPDRFELVEVGAGNGRLAADVMDALAELDQRFYEVVSCRLIEAEPTLRELQREMLAGHPEKVAWSDPADLAAGRLTFSGCLYSNELIDSFPVHLVEMTREGLREVCLTAADGELAETVAEPSTPELAEYLERLGITLMAGQRAEINLAARSWLKSVARALSRGFVLTIDYGFPAAELYAPIRKNGTLLCYYRHTIEENPYIRLGQQDITSHVDFTTLIRDGEELGLGRVWFGEQYRFLMGAGMLEELMALEASAATEEERLKNRLTLKKLMLPDGGMGDTFKVLIQAKGVDDPRLLCMREWAKGF